MQAQDRSPADIRAVFSQNLTEPMGASPNAPALCRELSLNRTQFNRYLAGESFHRPDILQKICLHFGLDARILLQPLSELKNDPSNAQTFLDYVSF
jgi:transcriptional regulator with XRE-family HTH domain